MLRFFVCLVLTLCAFAITRTEATANSYGSHDGFGCYGRLGTVYENIATRRDIRQARREARQASRQARWGGSSGSYGSYGSSGSTSYEAAEPVAEPVSYCPIETPAFEYLECPSCSRFPVLLERRRLLF